MSSSTPVTVTQPLSGQVIPGRVVSLGNSQSYHQSVAHLPPPPPGCHYVLVQRPPPRPAGRGSQPMYCSHRPSQPYPLARSRNPNLQVNVRTRPIGALLVSSSLIFMVCPPAGIAALALTGYVASRQDKTILPWANFAATRQALGTALRIGQN